jgi:hypothetical protein
MRSEASWCVETEQVRRPAAANQRPRPSKTLPDRGALLADIAVRRRQAQIAARRALEASVPVRAGTALASSGARQKGSRPWAERSKSAGEAASGSTWPTGA